MDSGCLRFRIVLDSGTTFRRQAACYSVISSIVLMKAAGYQFMVFAGDGLNSLTGVQLQTRGGQSRPHSCRSMRSRLVLLLQTIRYSPFSSLRLGLS